MFSAHALALFRSLNNAKQNFLHNAMMKGEIEPDLGDQEEDRDNRTFYEKYDIDFKKQHSYRCKGLPIRQRSTSVQAFKVDI